MYLDPFAEREGAATPLVQLSAAREGRFSFNRLWGSVYRSRFAIIGLVLAGVALAVAATLLMTPKYRAAASVEVKLEAQRVLGTEDQSNAETSVEADRFLQTQLDIIRSRTMAATVADALGLYVDPRFLDAMDVQFDEDGIPRSERDQARRGAVIATLQDNLTVKLTDATRIAVIQFESPDAGWAARVANSYAENFIKLNLRRKSDASRYSLDFLRDQLREAQARLSRSEQRAVDYARRTRIIDPGVAAQQNPDTAPRSLTTATLVQLNTEASSSAARRIAAEEKWRRTQGARLESIPEVLSNQAIQGLQRERAELEGEYQEQLQRRKADFPTVRQAAARIAELDRQIRTISNDIRNSIQQDYLVARAQEQGIQARLAGLKTSTLNEQNQGIQLSILRREAQTNRQQFDALLNRYNQINAESGVQTNNLSLVDEAQVPNAPFSPRIVLNVALGLLLGLGAAAAFVLVREHLFDMVRAPEDVSERLGVKLLGAIPLAENDVLADLQDAKSPVSESFNAVRASLMFASPQGLPQSLLVTSTQASEGKSTACFALALSLAKLGKRILLIDADLRRPNVHRVLGIKNGRGVTSVLMGEAPIGDVVVREARPGIDVVTTGPIPVNPTDLLASNQFAALVRTLEGEYDHVLIDSAPVLGLADAPIIGSLAHGIVFVVESGRTRVRGAASAIERLAGTGGAVVGVILSRFDPSSLGYAYEYQYGYKYDYGAR